MLLQFVQWFCLAWTKSLRVGAPESKLQVVQNNAARVIHRKSGPWTWSYYSCSEAITLVARQTLTYKALNCAGSPVYLSRALLWKTSTRHYDHLVVSWLCRVPGGVSGTDPSMLQLPEFGMTCRHQSNSMPLSAVSTVTWGNIYSWRILGTRIHVFVNIEICMLKRMGTILHVVLYKNVK